MPYYDMFNYSNIPWNSKRNKIKKVVIERGVKNIGSFVFWSCSNLTSVTIPESVTSIGEHAFSKCSSLTTITIPNSVTSIGESAFEGCSGLISVTIPNSVTSIGECVFKDCSGLTSVTIPNSVTSIGDKAFYNCKGLATIAIPNSMTSIGEYAFYCCEGLTSVTIPNSVTSIGESAFIYCRNLVSVHISDLEAWCNISFESSYSNPLYYAHHLYLNGSEITNVIIPSSMTSVGRWVFCGCRDLTSIVIPNSVTSIGKSAFLDCSGLISIVIPNSVTRIGLSAFGGTKWYEKQSEGLIYIELVLYKYKGTMPKNTKIVIKEGTKSIAEGAFFYCSGLTSITIPNSVTSIGNTAFTGCTDLTSITIPNSVTSIESSAFYGCTGLTSITIPNSVTNIGNYAFQDCSGLTSLACEATIPPTCGSNCFYNVNKSIPVYVPANSIEAYKAADDWKNFTNIQEIPDNQKIADAVIAMINTIGKVEYTDACKGMIDAANEAYNALAADQKALVTNLDVLTKAQQTYDNLKAAAEKLVADKAKADAVIAKITAIGKVEYTEACKDKIDEANNAYNALTNDQKALVTNVEVLTTAKRTYDNLKAAAEKLVADKAKADAVIAKINAIGKVEYTYACKDKIDDANNAYNDLTADQKALVSNLDVLTTAKQTYDNLKTAAEKLAADKAKAEPVIAKINAIGNVEYTDACKNKIDEANNAYNALTADQKALVSNLDVLTTAQQTYESLKAAAEKLAAEKAAFDKYKSEQKDIIEALIKEDDSDAVKDIIKKAISDIDALGYEEAISLDDNKVNINSFVTSVNEAVEKQRAEDQKTNGIEELEFAEKVNIYDLNGRKITNSMLKSGLYIRNGKKMVVK